ncbi:fumarylacetoacetase [Thalassobaculum sp. OXR-137]|uniref:fumarylacetoacetase n=1 Tax=Thalassobaculum sp. OXR-137 TaxID=3100173 RepID=UPI002AC8E7B6|nr:fumarylacetoacetase [Thalassobaculum sp. OXR-137]WPZ32556.1 fumarylacetoacetase [Thalassobaculum sp. OXR-137]
MTRLNATHDPARKSWVESANAPGADFPIQNLPFGVFSQGDGPKRVGVAIGDRILDLTALEAAGTLVPAPGGTVFGDGVLNPFMALPQEVWSQTRARIAELLDAESGGPDGLVLVAWADATMHLPIFVRSFTDFYASREHASNVGSMFRGPDNALMPNWLHLPVGYNGRASTVVVSGTAIRRPNGQLKAPDADAPSFGPCRRLDIELEMGAIVGTPSAMGQPVTTAQAYDMIFGYVLLNDWSARDIQVWEYQPLGPFQAKAFATSISPWVVTREALEPFRVSTPERIKPLLPYLEEGSPNNFGISLEVDMAPSGGAAKTISRTNYRHMYFSSAQQLAHHSASGCAMCTGDLLGSGTVSGSTPDSLGSLLEITWNGRDPIDLGGVSRTFIEDGDTLTLRGWCEGAYRVGFGDCAGTVLPAVGYPGKG